MKVELLVSEWCPTCPQAERVWNAVAVQREFELAVIDLAQPEGRELAHRLRVRTIPALVIDGELKAVGVQTMTEALQMVAAAPPRRRASPRHAGMMLSGNDRRFVATAMIYLMVSGIWIAWHGGIGVDGANRGIVLHLFGAGFVQSLIYGLGAHMLPRFTGMPVVSGMPAKVQFAGHHSGLLLFTTGVFMHMSWLAIAGGLLLWLSMAIFAWRILPVLWPGADRRGSIGRKGIAR